MVKFNFTLELHVMSTNDSPNWSQINILIVDDNDSPLCPIFDALGAKYQHCFTIADADNTLINATLRHRPYNLICINTSDQNRAMSVFINALNTQSYYRHPSIITYTDDFNKILHPIDFKDLVTSAIERQHSKVQQSLEIFSNLAPRILLVEDNEINQKIILMMLANITDKIDVCDSGHTAIAKANEHEYDCILLDVGLPDINGFKVAKSLRANAKTADIPIIAVTAYISDREIASCFKSGMNDIVTKPVQSEHLKLAMAYAIPNKPKEPD